MAELVYEAFFRTVKNGRLQRYYLALEMGRSYYQVDAPTERTSPQAKWRHPKRRLK